MVMRTPQEQIKGLHRLAMLIAKSECNTGLMPPANGDVAFLQAVDTPRASQICYVSGGYDVWSYSPGTLSGYTLQSADLSMEDAAKVVVAEYHLAKAARIKARNPNADVPEIMDALARGYQKDKPTVVVAR